MVITNCCGIEEEQKVVICVKFWKLNATTNKKHVPSIVNEGGFGHGGKTWNVFFFYEFPGYQHMMIAFKEKYKVAFIMEWGAFV
jgi:hypothetical protein